MQTQIPEKSEISLNFIKTRKEVENQDNIVKKVDLVDDVSFYSFKSKVPYLDHQVSSISKIQKKLTNTKDMDNDYQSIFGSHRCYKNG